MPRKTRPALSFETLEDRTVPTLLGQQLFPADNPWNQSIAGAPVAVNSSAIIDNIIAHYGDNRLHPDFTQDHHTSAELFGIPFNVVHGNTTPLVDVVIDAYPDESDIVPTPIPSDAVIEHDYQDGPRFGLANRQDSHLLIWDIDNNIAYEFFHASRPNENADGKWHADQQTIWDLKTNTFRTLGYTSADAAGLPILPGLVRPDEALPVDQGGQGIINHALRFTLENDIILERFLYPASHTANPGNDDLVNQPAMGARFRLRADIDISYLLPQSRIIAQALKDYGMIVADNGSNFFITGTASSMDADNQVTLTWDDDDIQDWENGLFSLKFSDFEVVDLTPRVDRISIYSGDPGAEVIVEGQNFSGAAGQLQVLFGDTPATSATVLDDGHVRAIAPAGLGTVDVRVQSGVPTSYVTNYTGSIFGYGISAVQPDARFTYSNEPPTVALPARAAPDVVLFATANLSALGADDHGPGNLNYFWSVVSKPAGAADPTFPGNGTNAAQDMVAILHQSGTYTFRVTITDARGLTAASEVTIYVLQMPTSARVTPSVAKVRPGRRLQLYAFAYDQFGTLMEVQPTFVWKLNGLGRVTRLGRYAAPSKVGSSRVTATWLGLKATVKIKVVAKLGAFRMVAPRLGSEAS